MKHVGLEKRLELVGTTKARYLGYIREDEHYLYLTQAAALPEEAQTPAEIALAYFGEKSRRNLREYTVPRTAVEMKTYDLHIERMLLSYAELSKVASRGVFGKVKLARLRKFLKNMSEDSNG
ncbi:MAG: hypothetical protein V1743_04490 [Nanoarchaeota archaeon]